MTRVGIVFILLLQALVGASAIADELRPAYLDMRETGPDEFSVLWKVPALGDLRLALYVRLPGSCKTKAEPVRGIEAGAFFERWNVACPNGLKGQEIVIDGLSSTVTDVLARIEYRGGTTQVARLRPDSPTLFIAGAQTGLEVARTYVLLGIDHILTSLDHLLFVLALILLISDYWKLVKTITAFTVAHSITLAGAALGYLSLPQKPVEATIALSIAFLASELIKMQPGERRLSEDYPWVVAFAFGLLHGFGFAGALKEIGLPQTDVPLALLMFNLGVEAGQLLFVLAVLIGLRSTRALFTVPVAPARLAAAYLIGATSMVWLVARVSSFWT
jgi:hydrogenase/urease accessory protein HupE